MPYELIFTDYFLKDIKSLDHSVKVHIKKLYDKIEKDPFRFKPLHGDIATFRVRISNYRLIYKVRGNDIIMLRFEKRSKVYK